MPTGCMSTLFQGGSEVEDTFSPAPRLLRHHDVGVKDEHKYVKVMSRDDDVNNVAGHRLHPPFVIEEVLSLRVRGRRPLWE